MAAMTRNHTMEVAPDEMEKETYADVYGDVYVNRTYKACVFEMLFGNKKELLNLYNAANKSNYTDPDLLEINMLENAIYMGIKNDISFIIDSRLNLYEHQSTYSPNLPLRFLLYISDLLSGMVKGRKLYSKSLADYSEFTSRSRKYAKNMSPKEAVVRAVNECIQEGILAEFLSRNKEQVMKSFLYEYDFEEHMRQIGEENWELGHEEGKRKKLLEQIQKKLAKGKSVEEIADALEECPEIIEDMINTHLR